MDIEVAAKIVALLAAILGIPKIWREISDHRRLRLKDRLETSKELVASLGKDSHPLVTECAYQALTGDDSLNSTEIRGCLALQQPYTALRRYKQGRRFLTFDPLKAKTPFDFKDKYQDKRYRSKTSLRYAITYFFASFAAAAPLLFAENIFGRITNIVLIGLAAWLLFVGRTAKYSLDQYMHLLAAEDLVKQQQRKV